MYRGPRLCRDLRPDFIGTPNGLESRQSRDFRFAPAGTNINSKHETRYSEQITMIKFLNEAYLVFKIWNLFRISGLVFRN